MSSWIEPIQMVGSMENWAAWFIPDFPRGVKINGADASQLRSKRVDVRPMLALEFTLYVVRDSGYHICFKRLNLTQDVRGCLFAPAHYSP